MPGQGSVTHLRRRRIASLVSVAAMVLALVAIASVFVAPSGAASQRFTVGPSSPGSATFTVPHPAWVTVHFDHPTMTGMAMRYWMEGGPQMMFDHSMMTAGDSYSFWSWGGSYVCGAQMLTASAGPVPAWVNATWGPF